MRYSLTWLISMWLAMPASFAIGGDSGPYTLSERYTAGDQYMGIRLHGAVQIPAIEKSGFRVIELSDLAWDKETALLYAVNDQGVLFHLKPYIIENNLSRIDVLAAYPLQDSKGKNLRGGSADSEGMSLYQHDKASQNLAISFERTPRIELYNLQGQFQRSLVLAKALKQSTKYRSRNKMLEALIWHPKYGLITGAEMPFRGETVHKLFDEKGNFWHFPPHKAPNSSLVALEMWPDSQDLLILERAYVAPWQPLVISLRHLHACPPNQSRNCGIETIAEFDSSQGWRLDNFEGLAHHQGRFFFMVSDDNNSLLQQTIVVYFELL